MSRIELTAIILFLLPAAGLRADDVRLVGPVAGFVFDAQAHAVRPIVGVPGSSYVGDEAVSGVDLAAVSPDGKHLLVVRKGQAFLIRDLQKEVPLDVAIDGIDGMIWDPTSSAAFIYSSTARRGQFWKDLTSTPRLAGAASLPETGTLIAAAMAETGAVAVATDDGAIYSLSPDATARLLTRVERLGGLAAAGKDLLVADRKRQEVLRINNFAETADVMLLAGAGHGVSDPVAVAVSRGRLYIAGGESHSLLVLDAVSLEFITRLEMDFEPSRLEPLAGSLFLLNAGKEGAEPLQMLDATARPAVYFVPARRAGGEE